MMRFSWTHQLTSFMTSRNFLFFILLAFPLHLSAQPSPSAYADLITEAQLKENLSIIASDALEGRETGTRGQKMAAAFISHHFKMLGLTAPINGSYYQPFDLYKAVPGEVYLTTGGTTFQNFKDIVDLVIIGCKYIRDVPHRHMRYSYIDGIPGYATTFSFGFYNVGDVIFYYHFC